MIDPTQLNYATMSLGEKQKWFPLLVADLIIYIHEAGYQVKFGDAFRDARVHGELGEKKGYGHRNSCHKYRLAIDLLLFIDGVYLTETPAYERVGRYWESLNPAFKWGGHFDDGNHFSITHNNHT